MHFWTAYLVVGLGLLESAWGAGNGGHGHPSDLIAPLVNVVILGAFLIIKLRKPLSDHFTTKAIEISNTLERASLKSKEAQVMLDAQEKKMANLESELRDISKTAEQDVKNFERAYSKEIEEKSFKVKSDATNKIEAERKAIVGELNASLLDQVIAKAKTTIKGSSDYQNKASSKILQGISK